MVKKVATCIVYAAMALLIFDIGCTRSRNRELAQGFTVQFDQIVEQRKALDKLEEQGKQYNEQLEKALQQPDATRKAKALGVWVGEYKAMLSRARSHVDAQNTIVDKLVSDSAQFTGDAAKYARETADALRDSVSLEQRGADVGGQVIELLESYIDDPKNTNLGQLEELTKGLEDLDAREKQAFQRAQDATIRLRAAAGLS